MIPQHLFTVNWADSGPGFSWPAAYYATWVPYYERFVVTDSADCPDAFGYADVAVGHFGQEEDLLEGSRRIVVEDWRFRIGEWDQGRWAYLFFEGTPRFGRGRLLGGRGVGGRSDGPQYMGRSGGVRAAVRAVGRGRRRRDRGHRVDVGDVADRRRTSRSAWGTTLFSRFSCRCQSDPRKRVVALRFPGEIAGVEKCHRFALGQGLKARQVRSGRLPR